MRRLSLSTQKIHKINLPLSPVCRSCVNVPAPALFFQYNNIDSQLYLVGIISFKNISGHSWGKIGSFLNLAEDVDKALAILATCSCDNWSNTQSCPSQHSEQPHWALVTQKSSCSAGVHRICPSTSWFTHQLSFSRQAQLLSLFPQWVFYPQSVFPHRSMTTARGMGW